MRLLRSDHTNVVFSNLWTHISVSLQFVAHSLEHFVSSVCASLFPSHSHVRVWREIAESYLTWYAFRPLAGLI